MITKPECMESTQQKRRRKLSRLLHTRNALIFLCALTLADSSFVILQLFMDVLALNNHFEENVPTLVQHLGELYPEDFANFPSTELGAVLEWLGILSGRLNSTVYAKRVASVAFDDIMEMNESYPIRPETTTQSPGDEITRDKNSTQYPPLKYYSHHDLYVEVSHYLHILSITVLALMTTEVLVKIGAMGKSFFNCKTHKLEMFDAFVIITSFSLDLAFIHGIWYQPGKVATILLLVLFPWKLIRICTCFTMLLQRQHHIHMKQLKRGKQQVKEKLRVAGDKMAIIKKERSLLKQLCRRYGAREDEINACNEMYRRRTSIQKIAGVFSSIMSSIGSGINHQPAADSDTSDSDDESIGGSAGAVESEMISALDTFISSLSRRDSVANLNPADLMKEVPALRGLRRHHSSSSLNSIQEADKDEVQAKEDPAHKAVRQTTLTSSPRGTPSGTPKALMRRVNSLQNNPTGNLQQDHKSVVSPLATSQKKFLPSRHRLISTQSCNSIESTSSTNGKTARPISIDSGNDSTADSPSDMHVNMPVTSQASLGDDASQADNDKSSMTTEGSSHSDEDSFSNEKVLFTTEF